MLVLGLLYVYDPATSAWYPSCPFRALTGLLCPLCGSLRAAHALAHGRIVDAYLLNPFVLVSGIALVITPELKFGPTSAADTRHRRNVGPSFSSGAASVWMGAALVFTVLRNLP